ncbi:MAG: RNA polymerase sigma factor [Breznakibacter sp.]
METKTEQDYIRQIQDGNTLLFSYILDTYARKVHALIVRIVASHEDAEELTQDVFVKCFNKLGTFRGDCRFSTWLYRIAYNTAISATRKRKTASPFMDESLLQNVPDSGVDELLNNESDEDVLMQLEGAVNELPPDEKALVTLYYHHDKSVQELAVILGISPANVKIKLFRIRKKLYVWMKQTSHGSR